MVACVKWTGGGHPVPIRQMSTSQREHPTQQPTWQRGGRTGQRNCMDWFCPSRLLTQADWGEPEVWGQAVCQQLLEENSMFTDPSDSLQNTSKHFTDIVSCILPQSHVFPSYALAHGATERWPSKITTRDGQSCQGRTELPRALTLSHQLPSQQWESSWAEKAKKGPL